MRFNSYVVRLKEDAMKINDAKLRGFNSYVVRLKEELSAATDVTGKGFNSYVVRLKGILPTLRAAEDLPVSIPMWCD